MAPEHGGVWMDPDGRYRLYGSRGIWRAPSRRQLGSDPALLQRHRHGGRAAGHAGWCLEGRLFTSLQLWFSIAGGSVDELAGDGPALLRAYAGSDAGGGYGADGNPSSGC